MQTSLSVLSYLQRNENIYPHKDLYTSVHIIFIHNSGKLEMTQRAINDERMIVVYPVNGWLFSNEEGRPIYSTS